MAKTRAVSGRASRPVWHGGVAALGLALAGCTINNETQQIVVQTVPPGADCVLNRGGALLARINPTPGTVTLAKTTEPIHFACSKAGHQPATYVNQPAPQPTGAADRVAGMFGQSSVGADVLYPSPVTITLLATPRPAVRKKPARIPFGALQPAPAPIPTPKVQSAPLGRPR